MQSTFYTLHPCKIPGSPRQDNAWASMLFSYLWVGIRQNKYSIPSMVMAGLCPCPEIISSNWLFLPQPVLLSPTDSD